MGASPIHNDEEDGDRDDHIERDRLSNSENPLKLSQSNEISAVESDETQTSPEKDLLRLRWNGLDKKALDQIHADAIHNDLKGLDDETEILYSQALQEYTSLLRLSNELTLFVILRLAGTHRKQDRFQEAESEIRQYVHHCTRLYGPTHDRTLRGIWRLVGLYLVQDRLEDIEVILPRMLDHFESDSQPDNRSTLHSIHMFGISFLYVSDFEKAESCLRRAVEGLSKLGNSVVLATSQWMLGNCLRQRDSCDDEAEAFRDDEAEALLADALKIYSLYGEKNINSLYNLYSPHGDPYLYDSLTILASLRDNVEKKRVEIPTAVLDRLDRMTESALEKNQTRP